MINMFSPPLEQIKSSLEVNKTLVTGSTPAVTSDTPLDPDSTKTVDETERSSSAFSEILENLISDHTTAISSSISSSKTKTPSSHSLKHDICKPETIDEDLEEDDPRLRLFDEL
jgi:hypothetical protein